MLLAIDVGNTTVGAGVFAGEELRATWQFSSEIRRTADEYGALLMDLLAHRGLSPSQINHIAVVSVVPPLTRVFVDVARGYFGVAALVVDAGIRTGVRILADNPKEVGPDRVVNAVAAHRLYGGPAIVIDFSTATSFDAVSREGDYLGAAIAPGIVIAADALISKTARLSRVDLVSPKHAIGRNTEAALRSGLVLGYVGLVEGIVGHMKREMGGSARVIATGAQAALIAGETAVVEAVDPFLTLKGLRMVFDLNRSGQEGGQ